MRRHGRPLLWAIACGLILAVPAAATSYRLLVERDGLRVYGPASPYAGGTCPRGALAVSRADVRTARGAVLLAVPKLYSGRGRGYRVVRSTGAGLAPVYPRTRGAKECGKRIFRRTIVVDVVFPQIARWSASLSQATFLVSRLREGWVIWYQAH
ncbi:MAG: hypothetical protein ACRDKU_05500 [Gaiellaceae bacterium]